jgi:hypothetical protein
MRTDDVRAQRLWCLTAKTWLQCNPKQMRLGLYGQAIKRIWWMPWRQQAMKDAVVCDKLRGADKQALIRRCPNGETHGFGRIPQGKQTRRIETSKYPEEKKSTEIPLVVASESGVALKSVKPSRTVWKVRRYRVIAPYAKGQTDEIE